MHVLSVGCITLHSFSSFGGGTGVKNRIICALVNLWNVGNLEMTPKGTLQLVFCVTYCVTAAIQGHSGGVPGTNCDGNNHRPRHLPQCCYCPHNGTLHRHARWPVDVAELFLQFCCWTLIRLSRHWAWLCRGYWCYRSFIDWLLDWTCKVWVTQKWASVKSM